MCRCWVRAIVIDWEMSNLQGAKIAFYIAIYIFFKFTNNIKMLVNYGYCDGKQILRATIAGLPHTYYISIGASVARQSKRI